MDADAFPRINRVIVTGFLQQDPELRHTPSGVAVASFRVRSGKITRDRRGALREAVSFFTVVVWQELAQRICREAKNGQAVCVEGSLHSRSFLASNGERKSVVEIYADAVEVHAVFLSPRDLRTPSGVEANGSHGAEHPPEHHSEHPPEHLPEHRRERRREERPEDRPAHDCEPPDGTLPREPEMGDISR